MPVLLKELRRAAALIILVAFGLCAPASVAAQELQIDPHVVDFGVVKPGTSSTRSLLIRNPGSSRIDVSLQLKDAPFSLDVDTLRLAPGSERRLPIHFDAIAVGAYTAELVLQIKELFGSEQLMVPLQVAVARPRVSVRPAAGISAPPIAVGESVQQSVQITNTGRVDLTIDSVAITPAGVGFTLNGPSPTRLPAGGALSLSVDFAPLVDGAVSGQLALFSADLAASVAHVPLTGEGLAPRLAVSPLVDVGIDFESVEVGARRQRLLTLLNRGRATLRLVATIPGESFTASGDTALRIEPGERRDIAVLFEPRYEGPAVGRVVLQSNDPAQPRLEVPLTGRAQVTPARVEVLNRSPVQFGSVPLGNPAREQLLLWNRGGSRYTTKLQLESGDDAEFSVETAAVLLQPGESGKVSLTFQPKEIGEREAVLLLDTEAGRQRLLLRGTGKFLKLAPSVHDFGRVPVGEASTGLIELVNIGNADFTISRIRSTSDDFTLYTQVSPDSKFLLPANSLRSLPISVTFEPSGRGLSTGTLRLEGFWEEGTETLEILLNGTGVAAEIELHPTGALDFGFVVLGDRTMRTLVATNSGDTALQVEANSLSHEARLEPTSFALDPGQSTTLRVDFAPEALGERFGQILLVSNDVRDKAQPIKIKGQGALENIDLASITSVSTSRRDEQQPMRVPWNNTPLVVPDGTKIDLHFQIPDSLRQALVGRRIDIEWVQLDENYDPKGAAKQSPVQIYEDAEGSVLAEDLNLRLKEAGIKRVRLKLTTHSYPGAPPQSISQVLEAGGWKWEFEAKPLVSFLTIRPGRDWTNSEGEKIKGEAERLIGLPGIAFVGFHNAEHPAVSGVHLTAIGNVLEALSTGNSIAVSLGLAVSMYKDKFLFGFGWDIYDSRARAKRKGSQDYIMTFKYSGLF